MVINEWSKICVIFTLTYFGFPSYCMGDKKVFSINTEFSIGKIFPQCTGIGKPWFSVLEKWLYSIEIFWNFHPCYCMKHVCLGMDAP